MNQNLSAIDLPGDPSHGVRCGLAARTVDGKAAYALADTKTTDDKAADALAAALLVTKVADDKAVARRQNKVVDAFATALLAVKTVDGKAAYALADAKTAADKAVDALATALLETKAVDNKSGASRVDTHALSNKYQGSNCPTRVEHLLISRIDGPSQQFVIVHRGGGFDLIILVLDLVH
jgi:hypothetical protein